MDRLRVVFLVLLIVSFIMPVFAGPSEDEVKAAFVFNFAKFINWPENTINGHFRVCFIGDQPLSGNLPLLSGRKVHDCEIQVKPWTVEEKCEVLFISAADRKRIPEVLQKLEGAPVLTVSDSPGFIKAGGMIGLLLVENKVRFEINLVVANKAGLKISSQLLSLAQEVLR